MESWSICNKKSDFDLIEKSFGVSKITSRLLVNRGLTKPEEIREYLYPTTAQLLNPHLLKDVSAACMVLKKKMSDNKKLRVIGDYDVDGVMSTYVLISMLEKLGADVDWRIPERIKDGYGINISMIDEAYADGIDTIITCDNGIAAYDQIEHANELGMTVIVTDHHDIPPVIPNAAAVINPKQDKCEYPGKNICGAVVAAKLMDVFVLDFCTETQKKEVLDGKSSVTELFLPYLAMATVCDVCELKGENRVIVKLGLEIMRTNPGRGLLALMELCGIEAENVDTYHLGFVIGPCFNATGRLSVADKALALLRASNDTEADMYAKECHSLNEERKAMTKEWLDNAVAEYEGSPLCQDMVVVIYLKGCHESLAGIIAGRLKERYGKPTIVLTDGKEGVKGSGRSIEAYNMFEEISRCRELLSKFGGHPMAAGMSLPNENIDEFRRQLNENCTLTAADIVQKVLIDAEVPFGLINEGVLEELELLKPFGNGNAKPLFAEKQLEVLAAYSIGKTTQYFKFKLKNAYGREMTALYFGSFEALEESLILKYGKLAVRNMFAGRGSGIKLTVTYYPQINEYMGLKSIQMVIQNVKI